MRASPGRGKWVYIAAAFGLFLVWSNSFVAASFLLGRERGPASFDFASLTVARFATIGPLCLAWVFGFRRRVSVELLRRFPLRLPVCGLLSVPVYNLALFAGQVVGEIETIPSTGARVSAIVTAARATLARLGVPERQPHGDKA